MKENQIITSIDVGTTKIAVIIAEKKNNSLNILGFGEEESHGLDKGIVVNIKNTVKSLKKAIAIAEEQAEHEIDSVKESAKIFENQINDINESIDETNNDESDLIDIKKTSKND